MNVLAVGAHPDDLEILAGGTLSKCVKRGDKVFNIIMTDGCYGHIKIKPKELKQIRKKEAENAASTIGANLIWMGYEDEYLIETNEIRTATLNTIRKAQPDIIITHHPEDYHPDHRAVSNIVFAASFLCTIPNIKTEFKPCTKMPAVFYMDTVTGLNFQPEIYVDITDTLNIKIEALKKHQSQIKWLKDHDNIDIIEMITSIARYRGIQSSVQYAEGFIQLKTWPRVTTKRLLP